MSLWIMTAGIAVWYWTLRGRFPALVRGAALVEETLAASRKIISDLLGEPGSEVELGPGDLRRQVAAP